MKFQDAYDRLQSIYRQLQSEDLIDIEEVVKLQEEAENLNTICKNIISKNGK